MAYVAPANPSVLNATTALLELPVPYALLDIQPRLAEHVIPATMYHQIPLSIAVSVPGSHHSA